jgi:hypothetical protein
VVGKAKTAIARQTREELAQAALGQPVVFHKLRPPRTEFGH